jgi:hypothetical protein
LNKNTASNYITSIEISDANIKMEIKDPPNFFSAMGAEIRPGVDFIIINFIRSFYVQRSQKRKNAVKQSVFFALLGSIRLKGARKHVGEIEPMKQTNNVF